MKTKPVTRRETVAITSVIPNPRNDKKHPREQLDMLKASIEAFGQPRDILVRAENRMIIAGHGVHRAMEELGRDEINVVLWDVDQATADKFLIADNRLGERGVIDIDARRALLEEIPEDEWPAIGFLPEEVAAILDDADDIIVKEVETEPVLDRFWISVRGPLADQALALQRLQELMAVMPEVEVELGTVSA